MSPTMDFIPWNDEFLLVKRVKDIAKQQNLLLLHCLTGEIHFCAYIPLTEL